MTYDAWDRLMSVTVGAATVTYAYDAMGRRVKETSGTPAVTTDVYFSDDWQVLEERASASTTQYVWSPLYVDALILRDWEGLGGVGGGDGLGGEDGMDGGEEGFSDGGGGGIGLTERLYVQQDANWNVTAIIEVTTGNPVVERYVYDPYGQPTFLNPMTWAPLTASAFDWEYLHQGGRHDAVTNLYNFRNRDLSPSLGRWLQNDPIRYAAGDTNLYRYVGNGPVGSVDPSGLLVDDDDFWAVNPIVKFGGWFGEKWVDWIEGGNKTKKKSEEVRRKILEEEEKRKPPIAERIMTGDLSPNPIGEMCKRDPLYRGDVNDGLRYAGVLAHVGMMWDASAGVFVRPQGGAGGGGAGALPLAPPRFLKLNLRSGEVSRTTAVVSGLMD